MPPTHPWEWADRPGFSLRPSRNWEWGLPLILFDQTSRSLAEAAARAADEYGAFYHSPDPSADIFWSDVVPVVGHPQADRSKPSGEGDLHTSALRMAGHVRERHLRHGSSVDQESFSHAAMGSRSFICSNTATPRLTCSSKRALPRAEMGDRPIHSPRWRRGDTYTLEMRRGAGLATSPPPPDGVGYVQRTVAPGRHSPVRQREVTCPQDWTTSRPPVRRTEERLPEAIVAPACPSLLYCSAPAQRNRSCSRRKMGGSTHSRSPQCDRHLMSDRARTRKKPFQTGRNEQFELDHGSCPGRTKQGQARSRH
jgi:hypothetical protein